MAKSKLESLLEEVKAQVEGLIEDDGFIYTDEDIVDAVKNCPALNK